MLGGKLTRQTASTITDPQQLRKEYARIRAAEYSKSNQESTEGIVGYAIPIRDGSGALVAAVHVSVLATRVTKAHESVMLPAARKCADQVEKLIGHECGSEHGRAPA